MKHVDEPISNDSGNRHFADIAGAALTRRSFLKAGAGASALSFLSTPMSAAASGFGPTSPSPTGGIGFTSIPASTADAVVVPPGYKVQVLYAWGDPVSSDVPPFNGNATETAAQQARASGDHHDGCHYFGFPVRQGNRVVESSDRGLWCVNHEYVDQELLAPDGTENWSLEKVRKSQHAHGVSVVEVRKQADGNWTVVRPSPFGRRIHVNTAVRYSGPAGRSELLRSGETGAAPATGWTGQGTLNNCAHGYTPWGTYLTCEENWNGYFAFQVPHPTLGRPLRAGDGPFTTAQRDAWNASVPREHQRYGVGFLRFETAPLNASDTRAPGVYFLGYSFGYRWEEFDPRFDSNLNRQECNRFGYVVEIDPFNPNSTPVKRTALGRFKHENAAWSIAADGRLVVYMGCDEVNEYIYKFVTARPYVPGNRAANANLLDEGTLYVARFDGAPTRGANGFPLPGFEPDSAAGTGVWLPLVIGQSGLAAPNTVWPGGPEWSSQDQVAVFTRQAADRAGATMMDRPEWIATHPTTKEVYCTLTNNSRRGTFSAVDGSGNPVYAPNNPNGGTAGGQARPGSDASNPRDGNIYGHIIRWREAGGDPAATTFEWDIFVNAGPGVGGDTRTIDLDARAGAANVRNIESDVGNINGDAFSAPDGLWIDPDGRLWIQTDMSTGAMYTDGFTTFGNNAMLCADPATRQVKRFLSGPVGCEVTGVHMTPDGRTMFVNMQHPGEPVLTVVGGTIRPAPSDNDPSNPTQYSHWPFNQPGASYGPPGRPRSATVVITREDGGKIGAA